MPIFSQMARVHLQDIPCHNFGVADIPEGTAVIIDLTNVDPQQALAIAVPASGGAITPPAGITTSLVKAGKAGNLANKGEAVAMADGAIALGDFVSISSTAGKMGRVKTATAGTVTIGMAKNAAADGDPIVVAISISKNS